MSDRRLIRTETKNAKDFFARLRQPEIATVNTIIQTISSLAVSHKRERYQRNPFFAVYGIGGNVTKTGERPDVDLLIATNAIWIHGYPTEENSDWVMGRLNDTFINEGYKVKIISKTPDEYSIGAVADQKGMMRLEPEDDGRKPIDIVIVNWKVLSNSLGEMINSIKEFERSIDIDESRRPLPKVLLFKT